MEKWELFLSCFGEKPDDIDYLRQKAAERFGEYKVYPGSLQKRSETIFFITRKETEKALMLCRSKEYWPLFTGQERKVCDTDVKICGMSHENCVQLRKLFAYLEPVSRGERRFSFGLGDRLGIASPGHIRCIKDFDVFPVLAQQSVRELNLTGRTFESVLDDACWGAFQEGYTGGFGADADHLKTKEEVRYAISCGYSMITLDCSEHINNAFFGMDENELQEEYEKIPKIIREEMESCYLGAGFKLDEQTAIRFDRPVLMKAVLVYKDAVEFINSVYHGVIEPSAKKIDFEVSIDETSVPTTPEAHCFIASELKKRNIIADNIAPRFCGEFQKGIDYIGDLREFEEQFIVHEKIAGHFGHRLSIHSGSDKFKVFPVIGKHTKLNVHVKTAGTNWLEAVRLIAETNPMLFKRILNFAVSNLEEAKKYYIIKAGTEHLPDIFALKDSELAGLLDDEDSRQILHITYGLILQEKDKNEEYAFKNELFETITGQEDKYYGNLKRHIGRHLAALGA